MKINTNNKEGRNTLLTCLISMGYAWHKNGANLTNVVAIESGYSQGLYPTVGVNPSTGDLCGYGHNISSHTWPKDAVEIIERLTKTYTVTEVGDDNYTATVTDEGIVVGCQTITFEKFEEIVKVVKDFQDSN